VEDASGPLDELFGALADPTRRRIVELLVREGPQSATRLADHFAFSRQAVVKHVQALAAAGLVTGERHGREVRYRATTERLRAAVTWLLDTGEAWDQRGTRLRARASPTG
jgi:DNA-binding transcriptional ArsR family regulator